MQYRAGVFATAENFQQTRTRIHAIVETVPAFLEEDVAAHFAGECCAGFFQLGFDERMAGFPQKRFAAVLFDPRFEITRRFNVVNDGGAGIARKHVGGEQHQLAIRENDVAAACNDAKTVAVAVEGEADFGVAFLQGGDQVFKVLRHRWIGMMVRKVAVDFTEQFFNGATETAEQCRCGCTSDTVAAIDGDFQRACELDAADNAFEILCGNVFFTIAAGAAGEAAGLRACAQRGDRFAGKCFAGQHDLDAVVLRRVVRAGEHGAGQRVEVVRGEIEHGRGNTADVDNIHAGGAQAGGQCRGQFGAGEAPVAADDDGVAAAFEQLGTDRAADDFNDFRCQRFADDAADVIGLEDFGWECGHVISSKSWPY